MGMGIASLRASASRSGGYLTAAFPDQELAHEIVNKRRGAQLSVPTVHDWPSHFSMQDDIFSHFNMEELVGCTTVEMRSRPVPHVFKTSDTQPLTDLFAKWYPSILQRLMPTLKAPIQTFNKTSRLGWPVFGRPDVKIEAIRPYFERAVRGDLDWLREAFIIMNVRLQAESKDKERDYIFIDSEGKVYEQKIGRSQRTVKTKHGERVASRTRLVFNLPVLNLLNQIFDTAMHNAEIIHPFASHNMYAPHATHGGMGELLAFDVKHFERSTASCVRLRSAMIGGLYAEVNAIFDSLPFLCPADDHKSRWLLWPDREGGWSEQFASGHSAVAPVQKEIFIALYGQFAVEVLGVPEHAAINWVLEGGDRRMRILNYGDDNAVFGDRAVLDQVVPFMSQFVKAEPEEPKKFLGFLWSEYGWRLGQQSYLSKTYLNERAPGSNFRKYPCFGWVEKRKVYRAFGMPEVARDVYPYENSLLEKFAHGWEGVEREAVIERSRLANEASIYQNANWLLGKDYLLSPEEKLASGQFEGLRPSETAVYLKALIGKEWSSKLNL